MKLSSIIILSCITICYCLFSWDKIDSELRKEMKNGRAVDIMIIMSEQLDFQNLRDYNGIHIGDMNHIQKGRFILSELQTLAKYSQASLISYLNRMGIKYKSYYVANQIVAWNVPPKIVSQIASRDDVSEINSNGPFDAQLEKAPYTPEFKLNDETEWNVEWINATYLFKLGYTGKGMVVANSDTGTDFQHPALLPNYRGNLGNGKIDHNYNWYDGVRSGSCGSCKCGSPVPCDSDSHGTHTIGTTAGLNGIGVAKGAKWISCRSIGGYTATAESFMNCLQFFLAPHDLDGRYPKPDLRPHSTGHSYGCRSGNATCKWNSWIHAINALNAAGVMVVASAGNAGSACNTVKGPPGNLEQVLTVAALGKKTDIIAYFSSRGVVMDDGSKRPKPDVAASGQDVRSSIPGGKYSTMSGTSMSCPAVNGAVGLLWSAVPELERNIELTKKILKETAHHQETKECSTTTLPNNVYGWGTIDLGKAYEYAKKIVGRKY